MNRKFIQSLYRELPELVGKGILSAETAEQIRKYYGDIERIKPRRAALTIFGVLGAVLVGLGIILLLAVNWENLSRPMRVVISLGILLSAQGLSGWTILREERSAAWREGTATFLMLAIAACIALIGQTYQVPGDLGRFLLTWMLLSLPLIYLMGASLPAVLYLAGVTAWAGYTRIDYQVLGVARPSILFWPLAALTVPHYWQAGRQNLYGIRQVNLFWVASICVCAGVGLTLMPIGVKPIFWIITYLSLFAVLYLTGSLWFGQGPTMWQRPFETLGAAGICILSYVLTFRSTWAGLVSLEDWFESSLLRSYVLIAVLLAGALVLLIISVRGRRPFQVLFGTAPLIVVIGYALVTWQGVALPGLLLLNAYLLSLGVGTISEGIRTGRMGTTNIGLLILATLIGARFFDIEMGLFSRAVGFIAVGIGFLATNVVLSRRRKGGAQ